MSDGLPGVHVETFCGNCQGRGTVRAKSRLGVAVVYDCSSCDGSGQGSVPAIDFAKALLSAQVLKALLEEAEHRGYGRGYDAGLDDGMTK